MINDARNNQELDTFAIDHPSASGMSHIQVSIGYSPECLCCGQPSSRVDEHAKIRHTKFINSRLQFKLCHARHANSDYNLRKEIRDGRWSWGYHCDDEEENQAGGVGGQPATETSKHAHIGLEHVG